jgi:uncharacterized protein
MKTLKRSVIVLFALVAMLYIAACAFLYFKQKQLLYFPVPLSAAPNGEAFEIKRPDAVLRGWVINPGQNKALLYFGGNAEQVERNAEFLRTCVPQHTVYLLPYRGYAESDGEPEEEAMLADALALYEFATARQQSISVMGRSLGSGIANYVASQRKVEKSVLVTPYDSIVNVASEHYPMFPISLLLTERFESNQFAKQVIAPTKLIIAGRDEVIPANRGAQLATYFPSKPKLGFFIHATHNSVSDEPGYQQEVCKFLLQQGAL